MVDRDKVIKALEFCTDPRIVNTCYGECPYAVADDEYKCVEMKRDALELLKEQEDEKKRIMNVIWDVLHEGLSIDTVADQDWVCEQIRHRIERTEE